MIDPTDVVSPTDEWFRCDVSYVENQAVVAVRGEVDLATAPLLLREVRACLSLRVESVVVDCKHLSFLDSAGVHALLDAHRDAADHGVTFTVKSVAPQSRRVLEVTGLAESFGLVTRPGGVLDHASGGPTAEAEQPL